MVQVFSPLDFDYGEAEELVAALRAEGIDAWRWRTEYQQGFGPPMLFELVVLWLALRMGEAAVNQAVAIAVEKLRERFRREPGGKPKRLHVFLYEGEEEMTISEVVELDSADAEPLRRPPDLDDWFEEITRSKPRRR